MAYANIQSRAMPFPARYVADLIAYRHLSLNLVASDIRARFRRSALGVLWAVLQPLGFSLMIALVWGTLMGAENYWQFALYVFSGFLVWEYFATVVSVSQDALIQAEGYIKQTRIPFLAFQVRIPLGSMVILFFGLIGLVVLQTALGRTPPLGPHLFLVPAFFLMLLVFALPLAIIMSILGTLYRDTKHISQLAIQGLFFISPVMLGREVLARPELQWLTYLNPVISLIGLFREPMIYGEGWTANELTIILAWTAGLWLIAIAMSIKVGRRIIFAL